MYGEYCMVNPNGLNKSKEWQGNSFNPNGPNASQQVRLIEFYISYSLHMSSLKKYLTN